MNLNQLRYFVAVARAKSLNKAASELRIAQPAISRQLKLLEEQLESVLFIRHHRGVELTDSGRLLLERAEFQIESFDRIQMDLRDRSFAPMGRLRIGAPPSLAKQVLASPIAAFSTQHPNVLIEVRESISERLVDAVLSDALDVAIVGSIRPHSHVSRELLFQEPIWVFACAGTRMPRTVPIKWLDKRPLLLARRNNSIRGMIEREASECGVVFHTVVESDSTRLIEELIVKGTGVAPAPFLSFGHLLADHLLVGAPLQSLRVERSIIRRKDRPMSRGIRELLSLLKPELDNLARRCVTS